jgi:hypothetical protein
MSPAERKAIRLQTLKSIAAELEHHIDNGSDWLYREPCGEPSPEDVLEVRLGVVAQIRNELVRRAKRGGSR